MNINPCERRIDTYKTLEMLGPEHEFSVVNEELKALPIVDKIVKDHHGRIVNFVKQPNFTFGKELQMHVMEIKPNAPFKSPLDFEDTMQQAVLTIQEFLQRKYHANLLGTGMHPLLRLDETSVWPHRHRQIYAALSKIFNLKQHGWLNIQSFQLNLPYANEKDGILLHNTLSILCAYLPAIAASSPVYEGRFGENVDNRLFFYRQNQKEVPAVTGDVIPEYASSFNQYMQNVIGKYSRGLADAGADNFLLNEDWVNSRGVIFRFNRHALEIRVIDEQECVKSDVALSCFIRALSRALLQEPVEFLPHRALMENYNSIVKEGLNAKVQHSRGRTARQVCKYLFRNAWDNATEEERKYLPIVQKRIEKGNLSEIIREKIQKKAQKADFEEAIVGVYSSLIKSLVNNQPYF